MKNEPSQRIWSSTLQQAVQRICSEDPARKEIHHPWNYNRRTYATSGAMMVELPAGMIEVDPDFDGKRGEARELLERHAAAVTWWCPFPIERLVSTLVDNGLDGRDVRLRERLEVIDAVVFAGRRFQAHTLERMADLARVCGAEVVEIGAGEARHVQDFLVFRIGRLRGVIAPLAASSSRVTYRKIPVTGFDRFPTNEQAAPAGGSQ